MERRVFIATLAGSFFAAALATRCRRRRYSSHRVCLPLTRTLPILDPPTASG